MDGIVNFQLFIISSIIIIIAPGPDFIYVTTRGISDGNKAGVISAFGISAGLLIHTLFAAFGLSAIIQASRIAYSIIKYLGAGYLLFIGIKALISKNNIAELKTCSTHKNGNILKQGIVTNVFNPKAIVTFMAFLPQFVNANILHPITQFTILGLVLSTMAIIWFGFVGYFAGTFGLIIKRNKIVQNGIKYISGSIMILLGLRLALKKD
ncbi:MAG: LysE family translocator [Bacteroidales bacterium]